MNKVISMMFALLFFSLSPLYAEVYRRRLPTTPFKKIAQVEPDVMVPNGYWYKGTGADNDQICPDLKIINRFNSTCYDEYADVVFLYIIDQIKAHAFLDFQACSQGTHSLFHPDDIRTEAPVIGTNPDGSPLYQYDDACQTGVGISNLEEYNNLARGFSNWLNACANNTCTMSQFDEIVNNTFFYHVMISNLFGYFAFQRVGPDIDETGSPRPEISANNSILLDSYQPPGFQITRSAPLPGGIIPRTYPEEVRCPPWSDEPGCYVRTESNWDNSEWCWQPISSEGIFRCRKYVAKNPWLPLFLVPAIYHPLISN